MSLLRQAKKPERLTWAYRRLAATIRFMIQITPDTAPWGHSPDILVWRYGDRNDERGRFVQTIKLLSYSLTKPFADGGVHHP